MLAAVSGVQLILLSRELEIVESLGPVDPDALGSDALTALGWGSKATQFHGQAGKAAAAALPEVRPSLSAFPG